MPLRSQAWNPRRGTPRAKMAVYATAFLVVICAMTACSDSKNGNGTAASGTPSGTPTSWAGTTPAPAFPTGLTWFNVDHPLKLSDLKGKAVLLDFWTLGCINCQDIIPDLKKLESDFGSALTVIGVHSGKYSTEHDNASIEDAIKKYGLTHPVVNDPDFAIWQASTSTRGRRSCSSTPTASSSAAHAGEGVYPLFQPIISSLISEFAAKGEINKAALPLSLEQHDSIDSALVSGQACSRTRRATGSSSPTPATTGSSSPTSMESWKRQSAPVSRASMTEQPPRRHSTGRRASRCRPTARRFTSPTLATTPFARSTWRRSK